MDWPVIMTACKVAIIIGASRYLLADHLRRRPGGPKLAPTGEPMGEPEGRARRDNGVASGSSPRWQVVAMTNVTQATVTCAACGDRQTFEGSQWEVTVATEVWPKTHSRAAHDGEMVAARVDRSDAQQGSAAPVRRDRC